MEYIGDYLPVLKKSVYKLLQIKQLNTIKLNEVVS